MLLYLFRHGIAIDREDPDCPAEAKRDLTPEGRTRTRQSAQGLLAMGIRPKLILSSPYVRAEHTAQLVAEVLGVPTKKIRVTQALLPTRSPKLLFRELAGFKENEVLCVGHAPHLDDCLAHALGLRAGKMELKKAGAAALELSSFVTPRAHLLWLMTPKSLRLMRRP